MDILSNAYSSVTGNIAKAKVKIKEMKRWKDADLNLREGTKPGGNLGGGLDLGGVGGAAGGAALNALEEAAQEQGASLIEAGLDAAGASGLLNEMAHMMDGYSREFEVQFNPRTLQIRGSGGGESSQMMQDFAGGDGNQLKRMKLSMDLSVKLIFDQTDIGTCFPASSVNTSMTAGLQKALSAASAAIGFQRSMPPVQVVVEGFIGALRNPATRQVCFEWGDLYYEGLLKSVRGKYTLFDAIGHPARAEVDLSIYLRDPTVKNDNGKRNLGYWQNAYEKAFSTSSSYVSGLQGLLHNS